jgi:hypothetical protein
MIGPSSTESHVNGTHDSRNASQRMTWKVKICHFVEARSLYNTVYELPLNTSLLLGRVQ